MPKEQYKNRTISIKGDVTVNNEEKELALSLMEEVAYDNGFFHRWNPERYEAKFINKIGRLAKIFFDENPLFLNEDFIQEFCSGEQGEKQQKYGHLVYYNELDIALDDYFNNHIY